MRTLYESQKSYDRRDGCDWCDTCDMCNLGKNDATKFDGYEREVFTAQHGTKPYISLSEFSQVTDTANATTRMRQHATDVTTLNVQLSTDQNT